MTIFSDAVAIAMVMVMFLLVGDGTENKIHFLLLTTIRGEGGRNATGNYCLFLQIGQNQRSEGAADRPTQSKWNHS